MTEITAIKSGSMDKVLKMEIRGVLARKYGKKLLDSWVPDEDAIKEAVEAGPPTDEELKAVDAPAEAEVEQVPAAEDVTAIEADTKEPEVVEETQAPAKEETQEAEDVTMKEPSASPTKATTPAPQPAEASSPADKDESAVSPASDLTSVPGSPVKSKSGRGASKRKASAQPRGAPQSKRSTKRRNTATPAVEEIPTEEPEVEQQEEEADPVELVPETPAPVEDEPPKRGRRTTKRESVVRRPSTRKATSPETSTRHSSPINPKRALSASSARSNSATPAAEGRPRRGRKGRGMRDGVVSKLAREQSAAEDSAREDEEMTPKAVEAEADEEEAEADEETEKEAKVDVEKDEEEEEERPATRTSRRTKSIAAPVEKGEDEGQDEEDEEEGEKPPPRTSRRGKDVETPVPEKAKEVEKKSTRRSSARGGESCSTPYAFATNVIVAPAEEEEKPEIKEEPKGKAIKRPRASSPREFKATRTMLNNLLDQISSHKHGSMFANPVKPVCSPSSFRSMLTLRMTRRGMKKSSNDLCLSRLSGPGLGKGRLRRSTSSRGMSCLFSRMSPSPPLVEWR